MAEYIEREAFLADKRHLYCENCARRKGMKNGKFKVLYEIGDDPCRACGINDVLEDVEDFPAADVVPVVRCGECKYRHDDDFCGGRGWPEQLVPDDGYCDTGARMDGDIK